MANKAHTATLNRICRNLGVSPAASGEFDIITNDLIVEVETSATLVDAVERLKSQKLPCYVAVTNKEGIQLAKSTVEGTGVGVMDPQGNVLVESTVKIEPKDH